VTARTPDQILESFQKSVALSDPTVDTAKGPMYSLIGNPLAQTLSPTEVEADTLNQTYSIDFALTADADQAEAFVDNWGESAGTGNPSTVPIVFLKYTQPDPNTTISIDVGSIVSNSDQSLQYATIESGTIDGSQAASYYNAQTRTWQITLNCQAVANGPQYDLPATRINTIVTQLDGIDAVTNLVDAYGGVAAETTIQQIQRVQQKFMGLAVNTPTGAVTRIQAYNPTLITDVMPVTSSNRELFKRISYTPATDYYLLGTNPMTVNETYTSANGGETLIPLQNVPSLSINSVTINGVVITNFTLVPDTSLAYGGSAQAADQLMISPTLMAGDVVVINNTYDALFSQVQNNVLSITKLFQTSELARQFNKIPVVITFQGQALPTYDPSAVSTAVGTALQTILTPSVWTETFQPNDVLQAINTQVSGLALGSTFQVFRRLTGSIGTIETLEFNDNEYPSYNANYVILNISST
jgi:hypothetical protein